MEEKFWICSGCGSVNEYHDSSDSKNECAVCGKLINETEAKKAKEEYKAAAKAESDAKRKKRLDEKEELIEKLKEAARRIKPLKKTKPTVKHDAVQSPLQKYWGYIISCLILIGIVIMTVARGIDGNIKADWIFYLVTVVLSAVVTVFVCPLIIDWDNGYDNFSGYLKIIPSGFLSSYVFASFVNGFWKDEIQGITEEGILFTILAGPILFVIFLFLSIVIAAIIVGITQILPMYIQKKKGENVGGVIGLCISIGLLYVYTYVAAGTIWRI